MQIPLCEHRGLCTTDCPNRETCLKTRTPGLIRTVITDERTGAVYQESYVNDIGVRRQEEIDQARLLLPRAPYHPRIDLADL